MISTPSTRRRLDGVAVWAEKGLSEELSGATDSLIDFYTGYMGKGYDEDECDSWGANYHWCEKSDPIDPCEGSCYIGGKKDGGGYFEDLSYCRRKSSMQSGRRVLETARGPSGAVACTQRCAGGVAGRLASRRARRDTGRVPRRCYVGYTEDECKSWNNDYVWCEKSKELCGPGQWCETCLYAPDDSWYSAWCSEHDPDWDDTTKAKCNSPEWDGYIWCGD